MAVGPQNTPSYKSYLVLSLDYRQFYCLLKEMVRKCEAMQDDSLSNGAVLKRFHDSRVHYHRHCYPLFYQVEAEA